MSFPSSFSTSTFIDLPTHLNSSQVTSSNSNEDSQPDLQQLATRSVLKSIFVKPIYRYEIQFTLPPLTLPADHSTTLQQFSTVQ